MCGFRHRSLLCQLPSRLSLRCIAVELRFKSISMPHPAESSAWKKFTNPIDSYGVLSFITHLPLALVKVISFMDLRGASPLV